MGKLIEKLRRAGQSEAPRMGFGIGNAPKARAAVLIAGLPDIDLRLARAARDQGADALTVAWDGRYSLETRLKELITAVPELPVGLTLQVEVDVVAAQGVGIAFVIARPEHWRLPSLRVDEIDRVAIADLSLPSDLLRTLDQLPFDAIAPAGQWTDTELSARTLMDVQRVLNVVRKPSLLQLRRALDPIELRAVRELGVEGVWLEVEAGELSGAVGALRKAIDELPASVRSPRRRYEALIPTPAARPTPSEMPEIDEDDD